MSAMWQRNGRQLVLAPMDDVTDVVFRQVLAQVAPPDIFFTEFTNVDALASAGRSAHLQRLKFTSSQRPIVAQLWGLVPEHFTQAAALCVELGFDAIDLNMGCPDKKVVAAGACSALINNRPLASEIIAATQAGAGTLPLSVKTRLGVQGLATEEWIGWLLEQELAAIIIHGRTVQELSRVPAHWDEIGRAVQLRDRLHADTVLIGNGDVTTYQQAQMYIDQYGVDGVMIGRGVFDNLFIFHPTKTIDEVSISERLQLFHQHAALFLETWGNQKNPDLMKKFMRLYLRDFSGAHAMRLRVAQTKTLPELLAVLEELQQAG